jgi:hypothetical protein
VPFYVMALTLHGVHGVEGDIRVLHQFLFMNLGALAWSVRGGSSAENEKSGAA